jgi:pyridoxine 4-dehydrogenase
MDMGIRKEGAFVGTRYRAGIGATNAGTICLGDLTVHRLGFGAMRLCGSHVWGKRWNRGFARRVLHRALDLGINLIDTADSYGPETNEIQIAESLYPYPAGLVVATKGGLLRPDRYSWVPNGRPEHLRRAIEGSLDRLKIERIDLYQLHAPDPEVPLAESIGALAEFQRAGKIRHIGISNVSVAELDQARRLAPIVSVQNEYNLRKRTSEDVLAKCESLSICFMPYFPLGGGRGLRALKVRRVADRHGIGLAQVALAWLLSRSPVVLPIPGTHSIEHLEENVRATKIELTKQDLDELE